MLRFATSAAVWAARAFAVVSAMISVRLFQNAYLEYHGVFGNGSGAIYIKVAVIAIPILALLAGTALGAASLAKSIWGRE